MIKDFLECGKIVSTHGIKGELRVIPWTNQPEHLLDFSRFFLDNKGSQSIKITASRLHKNMLLIKVKGINSIEEANTLRGKVLYLNRSDDPDDTPYIQDYFGISVTDADTGKSYGKVTDIIITGANDVFVLKDDKGTERLVPDIPHVVLDIDLDERTIIIRPLEGLFEDEN